ncbi:hypothetical protein YTPLAS18_02410 [Nitrospira sp.]|nr:hypothetical protein YTPLAS18_02410 [Nitrospira sp.]
MPVVSYTEQYKVEGRDLRRGHGEGLAETSLIPASRILRIVLAVHTGDVFIGYTEGLEQRLPGHGVVAFRMV